MSQPTNLDRCKKDLEGLTQLGGSMLLDLQGRAAREKRRTGHAPIKEDQELPTCDFEQNYQRWYTEALAVVRQLIPDRLDELQRLYGGDARRKGFSAQTYCIQDWLRGVVAVEDVLGEKPFDDLAIVIYQFQIQLRLLDAARSRFESSLHDIRQIVQADLFDSELDAARSLAKYGHLRAAGAVAGVVLERHLKEVCSSHHVVLTKKATIANYNDALKSASVLDVPTWRFIQRLGDLRNRCDHADEVAPTSEDLADLIAGTDRTIKSVF